MATILVIEDDASTRKILAVYLRGHGHVVLEAGDGKDGLRLVADWDVDVVVLDLHMPRYDGYCFLRGFAAATRRNPAILVTTGDCHGWLAGASALLMKPYRLRDVLNFVENHTRQGEAPQVRAKPGEGEGSPFVTGRLRRIPSLRDVPAE